MNRQSTVTRTDLLIQPEWLAGHLDDPAVRILDCTTYMYPQPVGPSRIESGLPDYLAGHIPGAQHVDMVKDLSDPAGQYPYTLPSPEQIEQLMSRLGVANDHKLVLYARSNLMTLTRAWYVLHTLGHRQISLLDGSLARWQALGLPITTSVPSFEPTRYRANLQARFIAGFDEVRDSLNRPDTTLVNALSAEQFSGTGGAHYGRPGRIPGSVSVPARNLSNSQTMEFESAERLQASFDQVGVQPGQRVINYCGGGIAATATAFALEMLGYPDWAVYDNSLLEWANRADAPMEKDER